MPEMQEAYGPSRHDSSESTSLGRQVLLTEYARRCQVRLTVHRRRRTPGRLLSNAPLTTGGSYRRGGDPPAAQL